METLDSSSFIPMQPVKGVSQVCEYTMSYGRPVCYGLLLNLYQAGWVSQEAQILSFLFLAGK